MRLKFGLIAILALAACESNGKPSKGMSVSPQDRFMEAFGKGPQPTQITPAPMTATPIPGPTRQATWTGQGQQVQTVTGQIAWQCQYNYAGQTFYLLMDGYCPAYTQVR